MSHEHVCTNDACEDIWFECPHGENCGAPEAEMMTCPKERADTKGTP